MAERVTDVHLRPAMPWLRVDVNGRIPAKCGDCDGVIQAHAVMYEGTSRSRLGRSVDLCEICGSRITAEHRNDLIRWERERYDNG